MNWNDLRYFLGVARSNSLTKTATELRVSQSTVARRILAFEKSAGITLFARHQTGYILTEMGRVVLEQAQLVEESFNRFEISLTGLDKKPSGTVRLATTETIATHLLIPALPSFMQEYPDIKLEIITGINNVELSRYEADMALRIERPNQGSLKIRKAGDLAWGIYGSVEYIKKHPAPIDKPLEGRALITWAPSYSHIHSARWLKQTLPDIKVALIIESIASQFAAAKAGIGLAVLPCFLAKTDNTLIQVMSASDVFMEDLWLVTHNDLSSLSRIKAVGDFLVNIVSKITD